MLRPAWPALSRIYGIKPWQIDLLTNGEVEAYLNDIFPKNE